MKADRLGSMETDYQAVALPYHTKGRMIMEKISLENELKKQFLSGQRNHYRTFCRRNKGSYRILHHGKK